MSIQSTTVEDFRNEVGGSEPVPAGVSISAVSASLALALLAKVLDITARRKDFTGDRVRIEQLIEAARDLSTQLTRIADDDVRAFNEYLAHVRANDKEGAAGAMAKAIEVPMSGARAAVHGLDLCAEGVAMVHGLTAADLTIGAALLSGAVRAMLVSVDFNLRHSGPDRESSAAVLAERHELELQALRRDDIITTAVRALLAVN